MAVLLGNMGRMMMKQWNEWRNLLSDKPMCVLYFLNLTSDLSSDEQIYDTMWGPPVMFVGLDSPQ